MITDITDPRPIVVDGGNSVILRMRGGELLVSTILEAHALADALRSIAWHLEQQAMLQNTRKDREAGRETNQAFTQQHRDWPGGTLSPAFTSSHAVTIPIEACTCTRLILCPDHGGSAA